MRALAARAAPWLNLSELAREVGVSVSTAKNGFSILEARFQVFVLRPVYVNPGTRLVKSPKVYFVGTRLLADLVGLCEAAHAAAVRWVELSWTTWSRRTCIKPWRRAE